jgi:hypothetical protein
MSRRPETSTDAFCESSTRLTGVSQKVLPATVFGVERVEVDFASGSLAGFYGNGGPQSTSSVTALG